MKKWLPGIIIALILLVFVLVLFHKKQQTFSFKAEKDFFIENPSRINRIYISNGAKRVKLVQNRGRWMLNDQYFGDKSRIRFFLSLLSRLEVQSKLPRSQQKKVQEWFQNDAIEVRLSHNNQDMSAFFVVQSPVNPSHVFVQKKGADDIYLINLPGYSERYFSIFKDLSIDDWRNQIIFNYYPGEILSVNLVHPKNPQASFLIEQKEPGNFSLYQLKPREKLNHFNEEAVVRYINYYQNIKFSESLMGRESLKDSLLNEVPEQKITVKDRAGGTKELWIYPILLEQGTPRQAPSFDLNECYGLFNNKEELVKIKYVDIDPVIKSMDYFLTPE